MSTAPAAGPNTLSYVYAVTAAGPEADDVVSAGTGMAGGPLRTVRQGGLAAVVCDVPEADFDEAGLRAQLEDLERLEHLARAHHEVVESLSEATTVLPLRLATVYRGDDHVAAMLRESRDAFEARIDRLRDGVEWGVKIYLRPRPADSGDTEPAAAGPSASPGRDFLRRRRAQRDSRQQARRRAGETAGRVRDAAARYATAHVAHRPQEGRLATEAVSGENLVNDAYLVHRALGEEFRQALADAARDGGEVEVVVTGPWAPYSFAAPEEETHTAAPPQEQADAR